LLVFEFHDQFCGHFCGEHFLTHFPFTLLSLVYPAAQTHPGEQILAQGLGIPLQSLWQCPLQALRTSFAGHAGLGVVFNGTHLQEIASQEFPAAHFATLVHLVGGGAV
jgi:hypothetical protein